MKITYTLEQWRKENNATAHVITFWYKISSSTITNLNPNSNGTWTQVTALSTTSPIASATAATALDGNLITNKVTLFNISIPSLSLANNEYIMLKWEDPDHTGADHGLAIDDVTINWTVAPAGPTVTTTSNSGLEGTVDAFLTGTINANGTTTNASFEYGTTVAYGSTATATPSPVTGTTTTDIDAYVSSLALNTLYHYRAVGSVSAVPTYGSDLTFYTLAATPGVVVVNNPLQTTLDVTVNTTTENGNPATTEYVIQETGGQYVQADGTLGATAIWQTTSDWATTTVTGLTTATNYTFQVKARNGANVETAFGGSASETTLAAQLVDYAVVQFPNTTQTILEGGSLTVYIRAYEPGLTTLSGEQANLFGWVGYSSTNDDPSNIGWTWVPAAFNAEYGNDDEYQATLSGLPIGTYYYAARFQIGTGPFVYGGSSGVWNNNNITLNVNADVVDFANIQFPATATITEGETETIYAQVYEPGVTEGAGQGANITVEIGYSTTNTTPDGTWTWLSTTYNTDSGNNDEYQVNLGTGLTPGTYYYASRFIKTGSGTYVYGGTSGVWNNDNGVLTVEALGTPVATAGTLIGQTVFTANWNSVAAATSYEIDVYEQETIVATDLFISEYVEGSSNNKYIEIYNGTGANVDLADYDLAIYSNGNTFTGGTLALSGSLANGSTFVIRNSSATVWGGTSDISTAVAVMTFNGNDVIALRYLGTNIDVVGTIGSSANFAINTTLTRNSSIISPTTTYDAGQWTSSAEDTVTNLGTHTFDGGVSSTYVLQNENVNNVTSYEVTGLNPETTYYYVVRAVLGTVTSGNSNEIEVTTKPSVVTWNGTEWSNIDGPDATIDAIIDGVFETATDGEFIAKKLNVVSGSLTVSSGTTITVEDIFENELTAAEVVVENNANLIQSNDVNNIGSITVQRNSAEIMRLDYTLWSSPVVGQNLLDFSPATLANRFYVYNPSNNQYTTIAPAANNFAEGTGYLIRAADNHPTTPTTWTGTFVGEPHNGDVTVTVDTNTYNAVGNPYPSTISADDFINENGLTEALYFWRKINGATGSAYATYTLAGGAGTGSSSSNAEVPNGIIQVGQGFIARSTSTSLVFTNEMRIANQDNQFFRNVDENRSRIWLNISNEQNVLGQTMIAYLENSSVNFDAMYDGKYINDSQTALTSLIGTEEYAVQARGTYSALDIVPLSFKTETAGTYSISLANLDGLFTTDEEIFVKDNLVGIEHNLRDSAYQFTAESGVFANRFEVIYQSTLSVVTPDLANQTIVFVKDNVLNVQAGSAIINNIQVFDVQGRLVYESKDIDASTFTTALHKVSNGILLVKITTEDGITSTKKVNK
ncbi:lamin tail domain-containing protein [Flavobacterium sp.]|uniref:lamin tail domain-containing protein n=1 Tax=Flavobacterium sp. TaxID=239 RepID=UPI003529CDE3